MDFNGPQSGVRVARATVALWRVGRGRGSVHTSFRPACIFQRQFEIDFALLYPLTEISETL